MSRQVARKMRHQYGRDGHDRNREAYEDFQTRRESATKVHVPSAALLTYESSAQPPDTRQGTVNRWFDDRGYGFIAPDDGPPNVFVHATAVQMDGHVSLRMGQRVEFLAVPGAKHLQAITVRLLEDVSSTTKER